MVILLILKKNQKSLIYFGLQYRSITEENNFLQVPAEATRRAEGMRLQSQDASFPKGQSRKREMSGETPPP